MTNETLTLDQQELYADARQAANEIINSRINLGYPLGVAAITANVSDELGGEITDDDKRLRAIVTVCIDAALNPSSRY